ncbi:hypothetical protein RIF29_36922 [Crotalaria pallida]|uniref:Uncharacterized protein n=1 Tax=Crotalaria pallida TaxID=3830 RepID=A0AAN9EC11_CROPI
MGLQYNCMTRIFSKKKQNKGIQPKLEAQSIKTTTTPLVEEEERGIDVTLGKLWSLMADMEERMKMMAMNTMEDEEEETSGVSHIDLDIESSISSQQPLPMMMMPMLLPRSAMLDVGTIAAELVIKNMEYDELMQEVDVMERKYWESSRKSELQKSLLEVLESKRLALLNENAIFS